MQVHSFFLLVALLVVPFCTSMSCYDKSLFEGDSTVLKIKDADHDYAYNKVASCATLTTEKNSEVCCYIKLKFKNHQYDETYTQRGCEIIDMTDALYGVDFDDIIDLYEEFINLNNTDANIEVKDLSIDCNSRFLQFVGLSLLLLLL